jgi:UDP:flavonoid glycosyltransferase YjiC (YdhE family)
MRADLSVEGARCVRLLLLSRTIAGEALPGDWEVLVSDEIGLKRFLGGLDVFVYTPSGPVDDAPTIPIAMAMAMGIPTILSPELRSRFGEGPLYAATGAVAPLIARLHADPRAYVEASRRGVSAASQFGPEVHRGRLHVLCGTPSEPPDAPPPRSKADKRLLFVSSNGVGLGHLTRLLAIARRCPSGVSPVFATMSQGFSVATQFGFPVEYIPFVTQSQFELADWDAWLARQLAGIIDFYRIDGLVFDGVRPFAGLVRALAIRRGLSATWVRRPMWRMDRQDQVLRLQRFFNLVIEPGEVAAAKDQGATLGYRGAVMRVPPIRLLEDDEVLDRKTAADRIGLDPARPAVLIQLGAGTNRDITALIDQVIAALRAHPEVQPVIAEWKMSSMPTEMWPDVPRLRAFPLARYYPAFDFTVSAAGYNSFNEIISFAMPTIFLPNADQVVDDQPRRAVFAEEEGAAIILPDQDPGSLRLAVETLLTERARWFLAANCRRLAQPNGARPAAEAIASTV